MIRGIANAIQLNPDGAVKDFKYFATACAGYPELPAEVSGLLMTMAITIKNGYGPDRWDEFMKSINAFAREALVKRFGF